MLQIYNLSVQGEQCKRTAQQLKKNYPGNATPSLIEAAQYCRDKQVARAAEILQVRGEQQLCSLAARAPKCYVCGEISKLSHREITMLPFQDCNNMFWMLLDQIYMLFVVSFDKFSHLYPF